MFIFDMLLGKMLRSLMAFVDPSGAPGGSDDETPPAEPPGKGGEPVIEPPPQTVKIGDEEFSLDEVSKWKESSGQTDTFRADVDRLSNEKRDLATKAELYDAMVAERDRGADRGQKGLTDLYFEPGNDPYQGIAQEDLSFYKGMDQRVMSMTENRLAHAMSYVMGHFGNQLFKMKHADLTPQEDKDVARLLNSRQFGDPDLALKHLRREAQEKTGKFYSEAELDKALTEREAKKQKELEEKKKRNLGGGGKPPAGGRPAGGRTLQEELEHQSKEQGIILE